jgi:hypothetical protein
MTKYLLFLAVILLMNILAVTQVKDTLPAADTILRIGMAKYQSECKYLTCSWSPQ